MNIILLEDSEEGILGGVIVTETTTDDEIQKIIDKIKENPSDDTIIDQIDKALPDDCTFVTRWGDELQTVEY